MRPDLVKKYTTLIALVAAFAALVTAGVFRREFPELARQYWSLIILGTAALAVAGAMIQSKVLSGSDPYPRALSAVFAFVLAAMYLQPQRVASDGIFYFTPLRSVIVDGDLDFENEYRVLGAPDGYFQRTETGRLPNNFSIGPALLWTPFYLFVHAVANLGLFRPTGFGYPYFTAVATATAVVGFLGVLWLFKLARIYFEPPVAFSATVLLWLGSFHLWYMVFEPSMSHAMAMAAVSGYLLLCSRGLVGWRAYTLAGVAAGLVVLIRWQNLIFIPVGFAVSMSKNRPQWWELATGAATAALVFLPQMIYWKLIYGSFLLVPQGGSYLRWGDPQFEAVLFSSRHGLLAWSPILWVGAIGFLGFFKKARVLAVGLAASLLVALYINASVTDWWAGASFGARRFDGTLPAFGLGLAAAIQWMVPRVRQHALVVASIVLSPLVLWVMLLMAAHSGGSVPVDGSVSFLQAGRDGLETVYGKTGYPFSWPGAVAEKLRTGLPLATYDLAGARHPSNNVDIRMGDNDALFLGPGWSLPRRGPVETYRSGSSGGAFLYVALREPAPYCLRVEGRSEGHLTLRMNGQIVGRFDLGGGTKIALEIDPETIVSGINEIAFFSPNRRSYSISRISLDRPGNI